MLTPQLDALRLQLQYAPERSKEQDELLEELRVLDEFANQLLRRMGATVPPGPTNPPKYCKSCGKPLP